MFEYKQRPWTRPLTDEEYNRAVGLTPQPPAPESPKPQDAATSDFDSWGVD